MLAQADSGLYRHAVNDRFQLYNSRLSSHTSRHLKVACWPILLKNTAEFGRVACP